MPKLDKTAAIPPTTTTVVKVVPKLSVTPEEAGQSLGIARSTIYELLNAGELAGFKIGRQRRIPVSSLEAYVERQVQLERDRTASNRYSPRRFPTGRLGLS